jgi:hypothetical protein
MRDRAEDRTPKLAADSFMKICREMIDVLHIGNQVIIQKKADVLKLDYQVLMNRNQK